MPFIRFSHQKVWRGIVFEAGVVYEVHERLIEKFVRLQGLAAEIDRSEAVSVGAEKVSTPEFESTPEPAPEPAPETPAVEKASVPQPPPPAGGVELRHRKGPWYDVEVDGKKVNKEALRKGDAEVFAQKLESGNESTESISTVSGETAD